MFHAHIAWALELIALGIGALLVLKCHRGYFRDIYPHTETITAENPRRSNHSHGFLKFVGYFIMALSVLGIICTSINYSHRAMNQDCINEYYNTNKVHHDKTDNNMVEPFQKVE
jgi:hypothetical protein